MSKTKYPQRKHPRIKNYDYASPGYYFVTICTYKKRCIFGQPNRLNMLGKIAEEGMRRIVQHFSAVAVDKFVIMPNHVHAILILKNGETNLSVVVGSYKSYVSKRIHEIEPDIQVWQSSFHDHVIRNQGGYEKIWTYIECNPLKWEDDCFYA